LKYNFAFVFTVEKTKSYLQNASVLLATSIKHNMPDVDVYCGLFTKHIPDQHIIDHLERLEVKIVYDQMTVHSEPPMNLFMRNFTKNYFAKTLLHEYDYLVYVDVDALMLNPLELDFDPTAGFHYVDQMPDWVKKFESTYTDIPDCNLYYNWIDIININNCHIFDMDYSDPKIQFKKQSEIIVSNRIDQSSLPKIQQTIGAYHCLHPLKYRHQFIHYDSFAEDGTFINLRSVFPDKYTRYKLLLERVLGVQITNEEGVWEQIMKDYS
jgi:hypothetical protein